MSSGLKTRSVADAASVRRHTAAGSNGYVSRRELLRWSLGGAMGLAATSWCRAGELPATDHSEQLALRPQDQLWLVSTRGIDGCALDDSAWNISRYEAAYWKPSSEDEFHRADGEGMPTLIYVHGNRMDAVGADSRGQAIYRELAGKHEGGPPVRFVIWSWPSDQIHGPVRDVRSKAARSDFEAPLLARLLAGIDSGRQVGLAGFSYGARMISGAMHMLGGGTHAGQTLKPAQRATFRAVFWAAAMPNHWLLPGNRLGSALPMGAAWLNVYTTCDPVLWRYGRVDKCDGGPALGYAGLAGKEQLEPGLRERYDDWDVVREIDGIHKSEPYFNHPDIIRRTRETLFAGSP